MSTDRDTFRFTGRHMLAVMLAFFGVIIAVNATLAFVANSSWTGFVVQNSYIASQEFNRKVEEGRRQAALGWRSELTIADGTLRFALADGEGRAVALAGGSAAFRRPASDAQDLTITLAPQGGGVLEGVAAKGDGVWIVEVLADAGLDADYREVRRVQVSGGSSR